jgi:hypothetical protein
MHRPRVVAYDGHRPACQGRELTDVRASAQIHHRRRGTGNFRQDGLVSGGANEHHPQPGGLKTLCKLREMPGRPALGQPVRRTARHKHHKPVRQRECVKRPVQPAKIRRPRRANPRCAGDLKEPFRGVNALLLECRGPVSAAGKRTNPLRMWAAEQPKVGRRAVVGLQIIHAREARPAQASPQREPLRHLPEARPRVRPHIVKPRHPARQPGELRAGQKHDVLARMVRADGVEHVAAKKNIPEGTKADDEDGTGHASDRVKAGTRLASGYLGLLCAAHWQLWAPG